MEFFGSLERLLSEDLYPYRVPLTAVAVAALVAVAAGAWRAGWVARLGSLARRRPAPAALVLLAALALLVPLGNYLVSPLWTRHELVEVSPLDPSYAGTVSEPRPRVASPGIEGGPPPVPGAASTPAAAQPVARVVSRGEWKGADDFHFARGRALVVEVAPGQYVLRVEEFSVRNGPDLFVLLSPSTEGYRDGALKLGRLKATDGAFNYEIPPGTDLGAFRSAVIWCEQFAVLFGTAPLTKS